MRRFPSIVAVAMALALAAGACSDDTPNTASVSSGSSPGREPVTITLVAHDSFAVSDDVLREFTDATGITVNVVKGGDAGQVVNQAILTKDNPQGDVLYGIDNTLLTKGAD